jgi:hypothetical protein
MKYQNENGVLTDRVVLVFITPNVSLSESKLAMNRA